MDSNSINSINSTCNLPSATVSGMDSTLGLSLMGTLDDDAIQSLLSSSTLDLGRLWSPTAILAPWTEFDVQSYAPNAFKHEIPSTLNGLCAQVQPHHSLPVPSPATSTESLSPFGLAHVLHNTTPSVFPVGYPGFAFQSPATMGQDSALPFPVGLPSPADLIAHAAQNTTAQTLPGVFAPCNAAASLVCQPMVSSANASPVQASGTADQRRPMRLESLFTRASTSAGQPLPSPPSLPGNLSAPHSNASLYPLPASASLPVLPHHEPHRLSNRAGATALPRSASLPDALKTCGCTCHQGASSIEGTMTVPGGLMHPSSLIQPVPAVKATVDSTSLHLRSPRMSTPASPQTNYHNAKPATATSAKSSPPVTIPPLIATTNALNTPSVSDVAEEVAPAGMRIRKTGLKRTHPCDQCPQSYVRAEHLRRHVKSKHLGLKEHACSTCNFRCSRSDNLRLHMRMMHDA